MLIEQIQRLSPELHSITIPILLSAVTVLLFILPFLSWFHLWDCPHTVISATWLQFWLSELERNRSLRNPSAHLSCFWTLCWPRIIRPTWAGFTWKGGQHLCKVLGLRELSFELRHWRIFNANIGKFLNSIFHLKLIRNQQGRNKEMAMKSNWMNGVMVFNERLHWVFGIKKTKKVMVVSLFAFSKWFGD